MCTSCSPYPCLYNHQLPLSVSLKCFCQKRSLPCGILPPLRVPKATGSRRHRNKGLLHQALEPFSIYLQLCRHPNRPFCCPSQTLEGLSFSLPSPVFLKHRKNFVLPASLPLPHRQSPVLFL